MKNPTFIETYENILSKKDCEYLLTVFKSFVYREEEKLYVDDNHAILDKKHFDRMSTILMKKVITPYLEKYSLHNMSKDIKISEPIKIQKTEPGQGYHVWHFERVGQSKYSLNRLLTFIVYLNDIEEGGETEFLYQNLRIKPKLGTVAIWPVDFTHPHRGNPPLDKTKYIVTGWVEFKD